MHQTFWKRFGNLRTLLLLLAEVFVFLVIWAVTQVFEDAFVGWLKVLYAQHGTQRVAVSLRWYADNPAIGIVVTCAITMAALWVIAFVDDLILKRRVLAVPTPHDDAVGWGQQRNPATTSPRQSAATTGNPTMRIGPDPVTKRMREHEMETLARRKLRAETLAAEEQLRQMRPPTTLEKAEAAIRDRIFQGAELQARRDVVAEVAGQSASRDPASQFSVRHSEPPPFIAIDHVATWRTFVDPGTEEEYEGWAESVTFRNTSSELIRRVTVEPFSILDREIDLGFIPTLLPGAEPFVKHVSYIKEALNKANRTLKAFHKTPVGVQFTVRYYGSRDHPQYVVPYELVYRKGDVAIAPMIGGTVDWLDASKAINADE